MNYFEVDTHVSNSDIKELCKRDGQKFDEPPNLKAIFEFGHLVENVIFQPHLVNWNHKDIELAKAMAKTYQKDPVCRMFLMVQDFRCQHEYYRSDRCGIGLSTKCMTDGDSKKLDMFLEFKGLSIDSENQFEEAIDRFDYDQGLAWYLDTTCYKRGLIVAGSKKSPDRLFKRIVDRDHVYYRRGLNKIHAGVATWKRYFG